MPRNGCAKTGRAEERDRPVAPGTRKGGRSLNNFLPRGGVVCPKPLALAKAGTIQKPGGQEKSGFLASEFVKIGPQWSLLRRNYFFSVVAVRRTKSAPELVAERGKERVAYCIDHPYATGARR